jgi:hypothetical protein
LPPCEPDGARAGRRDPISAALRTEGRREVHTCRHT